MSLFDIENIKVELCNFLTSETINIISLVSFSLMIFIGMIYSIVILSLKRKRKITVKSCLYIYEIWFIFDIALNVCECFLFGFYFDNYGACYMVSFVKFVLLMGLYATICIQNHLSLKNKKDKKLSFANNEKQYTFNIGSKENQIDEKPLNSQENVFSNSLCKIIKNNKGRVKSERSCSNAVRILNSICNENCDIGVSDVNIAYINALLSALSGKNLTTSESEFVSNLQFTLKSPPLKTVENITKLNDDFQFLVKMMCKYDVVI